MTFFVHKIVKPLLRKYVEYILFNHCDNRNYTQSLIWYANNDFCLGITKDAALRKTSEGKLFLCVMAAIHSYFSGIYTDPFWFDAAGHQDEICINFTAAGYFRFFRFPAKQFILGEDVLSDCFGKESYYFFEKFFKEEDFEKKRILIEHS